MILCMPVYTTKMPHHLLVILLLPASSTSSIFHHALQQQQQQRNLLSRKEKKGIRNYSTTIKYSTSYWMLSNGCYSFIHLNPSIHPSILCHPSILSALLSCL